MPGMIQVPFGHAFVSRLAPAMPPQAYKTYAMAMPLATHWAPATCEEYECDAYVHGFATTCDLDTDLGQRQAHFIRHDRTRRHHEQRLTMTVVKFVFPPGQRGFSPQHDHKLPIGRPPRFLVAGGDWRGNPRGTPTRIHKNAEDWTEDFAEHQDRLATAIKKG